MEKNEEEVGGLEWEELEWSPFPFSLTEQTWVNH